MLGVIAFFEVGFFRSGDVAEVCGVRIRFDLSLETARDRPEALPPALPLLKGIFNAMTPGEGEITRDKVKSTV